MKESKSPAEFSASITEDSGQSLKSAIILLGNNRDLVFSSDTFFIFLENIHNMKW